MKFPLFSMDGNQLTSLKGEVSSFFKLDLPDSEQMDSDSLVSFCSGVKQSLCNIGSDDFFKVYSIAGEVFLNTSSDVEAFGDIETVGQEDPINVLFKKGLNSTIDFLDDYIVCNGEYIKFVSVKRFPLEIDFSEFQDISDYILNFRKIDNLEAKAKLNLKRRLHFGQLFQNIKNIESENAYQEAEDLLEDITNYQESLFEVELYFLVKEETKAKVDLKTNEVISSLKEIDCECRIESIALASIFNGLIPGVRPIFLRKHLCPASFLVNLLPLKRDRIQNSGVTFTSRREKEVFLNIFDSSSHNYNCLITGSSGQGKSVLANKLLLEEVEAGASGVVLDLGNSFRKTVEFLDGNILSEQFNPMAFNDPVYLKEFILSFIDQPWDQREQGSLIRSIKELSRKADTFRDLISSLESNFSGIGLYFEELWDFFSNEKEELSGLIYCDLSKYPERLKRPLIIYLIECFKNQKGKRVFIFDECWNLLENNASYIAECFRTFRKHNASAIAISQNIDDFSETDLGKVIIQNTFYKLLFRQTVSNRVFLTTYEKELVSDVRSKKRKYSEFLILSEEIRKIVRYRPTPLEYELFTSDKSDVESFNKYYDDIGRFFGFNRAINNYVEAKYVGGEL